MLNATWDRPRLPQRHLQRWWLLLAARRGDVIGVNGGSDGDAGGGWGMLPEISRGAGEAAGDGEIEGEILIPETQLVVELGTVGDDVDGGAGGGKRVAGQSRVVEQGHVGGGSVGANDVEGSPVDPVIFGRIDGLHAASAGKGEIEREAGEIEIGQIFNGGMFEGIVGIIKDGDGEIGGIAENSADFEAGGRGVVDGSGGGESVEASQRESAVGLKFVDAFGQVVSSYPVRLWHRVGGMDGGGGRVEGGFSFGFGDLGDGNKLGWRVTGFGAGGRTAPSRSRLGLE